MGLIAIFLDVPKVYRLVSKLHRRQRPGALPLFKYTTHVWYWHHCFPQQLAAAQRETEALDQGHKGDHVRKHKEIHLVNLNEDPMLSGVIVHFIRDGETSIGRKDAEPVPNICLSGVR